MAHVSASKEFYPATGVLSSLVEWMGDTFVAIAENNPRLKAVRRLQALSDVQLDALGIVRADIPHLVFRDVYYR